VEVSKGRDPFAADTWAPHVVYLPCCVHHGLQHALICCLCEHPAHSALVISATLWPALPCLHTTPLVHAWRCCDQRHLLNPSHIQPRNNAQHTLPCAGTHMRTGTFPFAHTLRDPPTDNHMYAGERVAGAPEAHDVAW